MQENFKGRSRRGNKSSKTEYRLLNGQMKEKRTHNNLQNTNIKQKIE